MTRIVPDPILESDFCAAMRRLSSAVAIVAAMSEKDEPVGMAATSLTSLTVKPPAILVCINQSAGIHACLSEGAPLSISILSRHQQEVAQAFGGAVVRERRFDLGNWDPGEAGLPLLREAQAKLECHVERLIPYGTHSIVIARVTNAQVNETVDPLIYQDGIYL